MECRTALNLLEAYLDNELDRADARQLEAHADSCGSCREALSRLDDLRRQLREGALRYAAPLSLRERIEASARAGDSGSGRRTAAAWSRLAAACVLAFGVGGVATGWWYSAQDAATQSTRDLFASHWRALAAAAPVDVVSSDRHTVKPWFAGKVAIAPRVQDFAEQGFPLAGGRIDYVGTQRVPVLVYRHGQHVIDVFILPRGSAPPRDAQEQGYSLDVITFDAQPAAIISDMDATELARFKALLQQ